MKPAQARRVLDQVTRHVVTAARGIGRWVKGIWRRLTNEPGYAEAVAALVVEAADLFVLPSLWEGLPMALLEAMAAGLPVVATAVSGTRDVVVDGVTGILVPPGEESPLADAIQRMVTDRQAAEAMGLAGRQRIADEFSGSRLAERHAAMYAAALAGPRG